MSGYGVILADPPWRYDFSRSRSRRVERQYPTMSLAAIQAIPVASVAAPTCRLFLWATAPKLQEALAVLGAWGFRYATCDVWVKPQLGMGYYVRGRHELVLIGVRGPGAPPDPERRPASVFEAPRRRHSEKPHIVYERIEAMYPRERRLELFARERRDGWHVWGAEVESDICFPE